MQEDDSRNDLNSQSQTAVPGDAWRDAGGPGGDLGRGAERIQAAVEGVDGRARAGGDGRGPEGRRRVEGNAEGRRRVHGRPGSLTPHGGRAARHRGGGGRGSALGGGAAGSGHTTVS